MTKPLEFPKCLSHVEEIESIECLQMWYRFHQQEAKYHYGCAKRAHWQERDSIYSKWAQHMNCCRQLNRLIEKAEEIRVCP